MITGPFAACYSFEVTQFSLHSATQLPLTIIRLVPGTGAGANNRQ